MQEGRTIIDYPTVDSFFDEYEMEAKENAVPGFSFHRLSDPYYGRGFALHYTTKNKSEYGFEFGFGFTDSLLKLDVECSTPFDGTRWNTRGDEDSHSLYPLRVLGMKLCLLFTQISFTFSHK